MSRWWRAYDECVDDEKLLLLSDKLHRAWFNLLCLASKNNGRLPAIEVMCLKLRMPQAKVVAFIEELKDRKLLDERDDGIEPHNWNGRQYKSDVSTERVKRFRNAKRNVSVNAPETETETETDKERVLGAPRPTSDDWEQIKRSYPRRKGANPWKPAKAAYVAACRRNPENHSRMLSALKAGVGFDSDKIGTEFIPRASTWFREERWKDHQPTDQVIGISGFYASFDSPQLLAWEAHERANGRSGPRDKRGGWQFPSEWPPGHEAAA